VCSDLLVTNEATNASARLHFTNYNEEGYQFVCPTQRSFWLHWDTRVAVSPDTFSLHKMDLMNATAGWLHLVAKWPQVSNMTALVPLFAACTHAHKLCFCTVHAHTHSAVSCPAPTLPPSLRYKTVWRSTAGLPAHP
jgi:hypothetical protein